MLLIRPVTPAERPAFDRRGFGAGKRAFEVARLFYGFALDAEGAGRLGVIDVRIAVVAGHVAGGLELPAGRVPDAIALVVVAVIVEHDDGDRRLVARHAPQRLRAGEAEAAVADHGHHRHVGPRQLHAECRRHAPAQHIRAGAKILLVVAAERHQRVHGFSGIDVGDVAGVAVEIGFELEPEPLHADWRRIRQAARDRLPRFRHLRRIGPGLCRALLGDLLELRRGRHAADCRGEIGDGEPQIGHHGEIDRRATRKARRIEPDRDQFCARRRQFAPAIAEVEQHVGFSRIAHGAQMRADEQRMPGRERFRPIAEVAHLAGDRRAEKLGKLDQFLLAATPGDFVADADQRVLCLDQHARGFLDIVFVGADAHRYVELAALPDLRLGTPVQRIGRQRQEHRAAWRRGSEFQPAPRGLGDRRGRLRLPEPFGDRLGHQLVMIGLLPLIAAECVLIHRRHRD